MMLTVRFGDGHSGLLRFEIFSPMGGSESAVRPTKLSYCREFNLFKLVEDFLFSV